MSDHESEDEFNEGATGFGSDLEESDDEAGGFGDNDFSEDEEDKPKPVPTKFAQGLFKLIDASNTGKITKIELVDFCQSNTISTMTMTKALGLDQKYEVTQEYFFDKFAAGDLDFLKDVKVDLGRVRRNSVRKDPSSGSGRSFSKVQRSNPKTGSLQKRYASKRSAASKVITLNAFLKERLIPQYEEELNGIGFTTVNDLAMTTPKRLSQTSLPEYVLDGIIDKARERIKVVRTILRSNPSDPLGLGVLKMAEDVARNLEQLGSPEGAWACVTDSHEGKPAYDAGIRVGDLIHSINGTSVISSTHEEIMIMLRSAGSELKITVIPCEA